MILISEPIDIIVKAIGKQKISDDIYRPFTYIEQIECEQGFLLYNVFTKGLVLLNNDEYDAYKKIDLSDVTIKYLIENWFLVKKENDDYMLLKQVNSILKIFSGNSFGKKFNNFVIFPTTDCNARCFYCFEHASKRLAMSERLALDVAKFITEKSMSEKITLNWFGGEPLYNAKAIDIICGQLSKNGVPYKSKMVSNGYLFDNKTIKKAIENWNLYQVQITLDGTEEVYNRVKAYIYNDFGSPFKIVINNIENLLKSGVHVCIRLNMDLYNCTDLKELATYISNKFSSYNNFKIYVRFLYTHINDKYNPRSIENKKLLNQKFEEINEILKKNNVNIPSSFKSHNKLYNCMSDSDGSTTILPDGSLGKCEHFTDDNFYGNIYSEKIDYDVIDFFKEKIDFGTQCYNCNLLPNCQLLKNCPIRPLECDEFDKQQKNKSLRYEILESYESFIKNAKSSN